MYLKAQKTFYVNSSWALSDLDLVKALWAVLMAVWEAKVTLPSGHRKVGSVALNCTANRCQGQKPRQRVLITCSVLLTLCLHPSTAKGVFHLGKHRRGREQERSKIKNSGKEIAERKMLHTAEKLFVTWKQQQFSQAKPMETYLSLAQR